MSNTVTIPRITAIAIFVALNFKTADKWPDDRLNKRISQLADNVDDDAVKSVEDETTRKALKGVLKSLNDGDTVVVEAETKAEPAPKAKKKAADETPADETPAPAKKAKKPAEDDAGEEPDAPAPKAEKKAKVAKEPKAEKAEPAKDKFGNREGSQAAQINAQLAKKWVTVKAVADATSLSEARVRSHFKYLADKKLVELDADKGARVL